MKWKPLLVRMFLEFLLDKLPEIIKIILDDLGGNPGPHREDGEHKEEQP